MNKYNEAINTCLQVIGEQTIEGNLPIAGIYEAELADEVIERTKEEVLSEGWSFNTDENWNMIPDTSGYIAVSPSALRIDPSSTATNVIRKDGKLYDRTAHTYVFPASVQCDVVWNLDFDDMPVVAQQYIVLKAARILYQRVVGDKEMIAVLINDEQEARLRVLIHEDDINDYNIFDDNSVSRAITRSSNPVGIRG